MQLCAARAQFVVLLCAMIDFPFFEFLCLGFWLNFASFGFSQKTKRRSDTNKKERETGKKMRRGESAPGRLLVFFSSFLSARSPPSTSFLSSSSRYYSLARGRRRGETHARREQSRSSTCVRFFFSTSSSLDEEAKAAEGAVRDEARQHESLSSRGPSWSVNELVRGSGNSNDSSGGGGGGAISAEEFRKIAESVKLSFNDREEERLARREVEEIVRFSEMVLSSSSSSSDVKEGDDEQGLNRPTPRRRMDE